MKKTTNDHTGKLKESVDAVSKKSKEAIHGIIDNASRQFESALETNEKFMESIEKQIFGKDFPDNSIISETKKTFGSAVELSEEAIDTIIDIHNEQLQSAIDINMELLETIKNMDLKDKEDVNELVKVIEKNFEESSRQSIENTKKIIDVYNKHVNLALNFNERFSRNINNQVQILNRFQNKNRETFNDWATQWWKNMEEATA